MQDKKVLYLFTLDYPFGGKENAFIDPELQLLKDSFSKVVIVPLCYQPDLEKSKMADGIEVLDVFKGYVFSFKKSLRNISITFFKLFCIEFLSSPRKLHFLFTLKKQLDVFLWNFDRAYYLNSWIKTLDVDRGMFYTYWFSEWANLLSVLKLKHPQLHFVSRAHGFDLYAERHHDGFILFQNLNVKQADAIFLISKNGVSYLNKKYSKFSSKFNYAPLGVYEAGNNPEATSDVFTITTCAAVRPVKRVDKMIEILSHVSFPIKWVHFGDGEAMADLKVKVQRLPSTVQVEFKGFVSNADVLAYYKSTHVDLFMNTSESEGLPVSIMEAMSFGIPVIAPAIGGIPEIVNESCGVLIDRNFDSKQVASLIVDFKQKNMSEYRAQAKIVWSAGYDASKNFNTFIEHLLVIANSKANRD